MDTDSEVFRLGVRNMATDKQGLYVTRYDLRELKSYILRDIGGRTKVQQLTCNIDLSCFLSSFFCFVLLELKPFVLKGKVLGEKF